MNKSAISIAITSALIFPTIVIPAKASEVIPNGEYEVNFLTYKTGTTTTSGMAGRFEQPAKLIVKDSEFFLQLTIITQNQLLKNMSIPYFGKNVDMKTIEGDLTTNTRVVELPLESFETPITVTVDVIFPGSSTPVQQTFDLIVDAPDTEQLTEKVNLTMYYKNSSDVSTLQSKIDSKATLVYKGAQTFARVKFIDKASIHSFTVNGTKGKIISSSSDAFVTYEVELNDPKKLQSATIAVNYKGKVSNRNVDLHFGVKGAPVMIKNPFSDLGTISEKSAILNLLSKNIVAENKTFGPTKNATREQFALMIARTLKLTSSSKASYTDTKNLSANSISAIESLKKAGIVATAKKFSPKKAITREQAALMIYRAMQYHVGTTALDFGNNIQVYADAHLIKTEESARALSFLYVSKAYVGQTVDGKTYSNAKQTITRAEIAALLNNTLKYLGH